MDLSTAKAPKAMKILMGASLVKALHENAIKFFLAFKATAKIISNFKNFLKNRFEFKFIVGIEKNL